jgi:hypothetical protein
MKDIIENKLIIDKYYTYFNSINNENKYNIYNKFNKLINELITNTELSNTLNFTNINYKTIFWDNIFEDFIILMNIYVNDILINYLTPNEIKIFKYKTKKFYYANRFSSVIEYILFNNINISSILSITEINKMNEITDTNILFFICASYALLDTYIDEDYISNNKDNEINEINIVFNKYFDNLINSKQNNLDLSNNILNNSNIKIIEILNSLLDYILLYKYDIEVIEVIKYCFNLELKCFHTQLNSNQTNNELINMMCYKGISSLVLSFTSKDKYLTQFINNTISSNKNKLIKNLIYDFGIFGQLIDDICDYIEDTNDGKYVITSYKCNDNITGYECSILVYINKLLDLDNILNNDILNIKNTKVNKYFMLIHIYILYYAFNKCKNIINELDYPELYSLYKLLDKKLNKELINKLKNMKDNIKSFLV